MSYHAPCFLVSDVYRSSIELSDRYLTRLSLALSASVLFHALLLGTPDSVVNSGKVGQATSNSLHVTLMPAVKSRPHHEDVRHERAAIVTPVVPKIRKSLAAKAQKIAADKPEVSVPVASMPEIAAPDSPAQTGKDAAQAMGAALENMMSRQYMMMRVQQFFSLARSDTNTLIRSRLTPEELFQHRGKHCTLHLLVAPAPEHGYQLSQPECDDPELASKLQAIPWNTAMPLPSDYSLPYRGLTVNMEIGAFDVGIGLEPIVD